MPRPTRFSLLMQPVHEPRENPTLALERDLELIEHLDRLGFDEVWVGEHHSTDWETIASPDIFIVYSNRRGAHPAPQAGQRRGAAVAPSPTFGR